jgi:hypothetical protein
MTTAVAAAPLVAAVPIPMMAVATWSKRPVTIAACYAKEDGVTQSDAIFIYCPRKSVLSSSVPQFVSPSVQIRFICVPSILQ